MTGCDSCSVKSDNDPINVRASFTPNLPEHRVTYYEIYWWQGEDTTSWRLSDMALIDTVNWINTDSLLTPYFTITLNYIRAGGVSRNAEGKSVMALSKFCSYFDFAVPPPPENLRIVK